MTMYIYTGTPGSGKTLHAMCEILNKRRRRDIISNIESDLVHYNLDLMENPEVLLEWLQDDESFKHNKKLLVIDEAQLIFNSRNWNDKSRLSWLYFFSQHRKYGYDVILIAQDFNMIDKQFRALAHYEYSHRHLLFMFFYVVRYPVNRQRIGLRFFIPSHKAMKSYDTNQLA